MTNHRKEDLIKRNKFHKIRDLFVDLNKIEVSHLMGPVRSSGLYSGDEILDVVGRKYLEEEEEPVYIN